MCYLAKGSTKLSGQICSIFWATLNPPQGLKGRMLKGVVFIQPTQICRHHWAAVITEGAESHATLSLSALNSPVSVCPYGFLYNYTAGRADQYAL